MCENERPCAPRNTSRCLWSLVRPYPRGKYHNLEYKFGRILYGDIIAARGSSSVFMLPRYGIMLIGYFQYNLVILTFKRFYDGFVKTSLPTFPPSFLDRLDLYNVLSINTPHRVGLQGKKEVTFNCFFFFSEKREREICIKS